MRLFVALSISTEIRENLSSLIDGLRRADAKPKWINPDHLHVTLKFIGEVVTEKLSAISDALVTVQAGTADLLHPYEVPYANGSHDGCGA